MRRTPESLVSEALAAWILSRLEHENDFAREGLPAFDIPRLLRALSEGGLPAGSFSLALVGFEGTDEDVRATADANGLGGLTGVTIDLHVATEWRNDRDGHPRIIALARGYNPSVHGLRFFSRRVVERARGHSARMGGEGLGVHDDADTPAPVGDLAPCTGAFGSSVPGRRGRVSCRLEHGARRCNRSAARHAPALGLLRDPKLFEAKDLAKRLEDNLRVGERVTIMSPGDIRKLRVRANGYKDAKTAELVTGALDRLGAYRRGEADAGLTLADAERLVTLPPDPGPTRGGPADEPDDVDEPDDDDDSVEEEDDPGLRDMAVDALLEGREEDLAAIGEALEEAWEEIGQNGDRLAANQDTSRGVAKLDERVDTKIIEWVTEFCDTDRFGGVIETDVGDLRQALARHTEFNPVFLEPEAVWRHNGVPYSIEALLAGWDKVDAVAEACPRPIVAMWRDFIAAREQLVKDVRPFSSTLANGSTPIRKHGPAASATLR